MDLQNRWGEDPFFDTAEEPSFEGMPSEEYVPFGMMVWAQHQGATEPFWQEAVGASRIPGEDAYQFGELRLEYVTTEGSCRFYAGLAKESAEDDPEIAAIEGNLFYWTEEPTGPLQMPCYWEMITLLMLLFPKPLD